MLVRDLVDGQDIDLVLVVRERELRRRSDGTEDLALRLSDRSGTVEAVVADATCDEATSSNGTAGGVPTRDGASRQPPSPHRAARAGANWVGDPPISAACGTGTAVRVAGRVSVHPRHGPRVVVRALRPAAPEEYDPRDLVDGPPRSAAQMEADLRELLATIQSRHLRALLDRVLGAEQETWRRFRDAPAAKRYHQAYRHGLLEHSLSVAQAVSAISATFPGIDRDVAVAGALLHDIGKLEAYTADPLAIDMTDAGKLHGEIPLGYYRIRRLIEDLPGFPADVAAAVLHIILAHHGALEHGSPVLPCTREATLVHMIDNLGGRLGSFDRLEKELPRGSRWSGYDRALGGGAYFASAKEAA